MFLAYDFVDLIIDKVENYSTFQDLSITQPFKIFQLIQPLFSFCIAVLRFSILFSILSLNFYFTYAGNFIREYSTYSILVPSTQNQELKSDPLHAFLLWELRSLILHYGKKFFHIFNSFQQQLHFFPLVRIIWLFKTTLLCIVTSSTVWLLKHI